MKQLVFATTLLLLVTSVFFGAVSQQVLLNDNNTDDPPSVTIEALGRSQADLNEAVTQALNACRVRELLNDTRHRLLFSEWLSESRFQATVHDYTNGRTLLVQGVPFDPATISTTVVNAQPIPYEDELREAARIAGARRDEVVHPHMPPVLAHKFPNGTSHRILHISLASENSSRVAQVNMNNGTVVFPPSPQAEALANVPMPARQPLPFAPGTPGTAHINIFQGRTLLWTFQVTRPSASSGADGSAIELRYVRYKGKTVLNQAHAPILNVKYDRDVCGPYRDGERYEYNFHCTGQDIAPGFRLCNSPATTILDPPHIDGGDFAGVAIYVQGLEVVLKSQIAAGWYRYTVEWRFHVNGSIKPRFGFGAVSASCVTHVHNHHVYWRLDFDIVTPENNLVREYNDPPLFPPSNYHDKVYEIRRPKDVSRKRHWEISNTVRGDTYGLFPGPNDGPMDLAYGVGDLWVLKYKANEVDDSMVTTTGTDGTKEHIDAFLNGELVKNQNVVLWYGAHFKHDVSHPDAEEIVGPDIRPLRW